MITFLARKRASSASFLTIPLLLSLYTPSSHSSSLLVPSSSASSFSHSYSSTSSAYSGMAPVVLQPLKKHAGTVIFLHGLGDSGEGWKDGMQLVRKHNPHVKFILPTAPNKPVTINFGMLMPAWYNIVGLGADAKEDTQGLEATRSFVSGIIQQEIEQGIPPNRIIVGGFSQGAVVSLFTVYQHAVTLGGCIALSGHVPSYANFHLILHPANKQTPLLMYHGQSDEVIPYQYAKQSYEILKKIGLNLRFETVPSLGHSATIEELEDVAKFVKGIIPDE